MEALVPVPMDAPPQQSQPVVSNPMGEDQSGNTSIHNSSSTAGHEITQHQPSPPSPPTAAPLVEPAQQQENPSVSSAAAAVTPGVIAASSAAAENHAGGDGGVPSPAPAGAATSVPTPGAVKREGSGGSLSQPQPRSAKRSREASTQVGLPKNKVRRIMKIGEDTRNISNEALVIVVKASELFLERFATQALDHAEKLGRKTIKYRDVSDIRVNNPNLLFLEAVVPP